MITIKNDNTTNINLIGRTKGNENLYCVDQCLFIDEKGIEEVANRFILNNNISRLPVDVIEIAKHSGWVLIPFTKAPDFIKNKFSELMYTDWGFAIQQDTQFYIFYDDSVKIEVQRFTIAHEIGHIALNHFEDVDFCVKEKEANIFASCLLMPKVILKECNISSIKGIQIVCGVSHSAATFKQMKLVSNFDYEYNEQELDIVNQFKTYISDYYK